MARVLLVSKPVVPPWNDSSKNLARDVAANLTRHTAIVMGDAEPLTGRGFELGGAVVEPVYRARGSYAPAGAAQLRVLRRLALGARQDLWHFFFAPNPKTSTAGRVLARARRVPTVQTVCSRPRELARAPRLLFADRTVVLSRATERALLEAGVPGERLARIPPAVPALAPLDDDARADARCAFGLDPDAPLVLFPGDLELGEGAARVIEALPHLDPGARLAMACRPKTAGASAARARLEARARALGVASRVTWLGETDRIHALVGCADVVALPSTDLYAKMDLPLVLLEAMWLARPVVVAAGSVAEELADGGGAVASDPGPEALAEAIERARGDAALGPRAREVAAERHAVASMVAAYEALYDAVLEDRR